MRSPSTHNVSEIKNRFQDDECQCLSAKLHVLLVRSRLFLSKTNQGSTIFQVIPCIREMFFLVAVLLITAIDIGALDGDTSKARDLLDLAGEGVAVVRATG